MKTIIKIAWRNLWRNKLRTAVIITSIILGLWSSMFFMAMIDGVNENRTSIAINTYLGHIQIHQKNYLEDPKIDKTILDIDKVIKNISQSSEVVGYAPRTLIDAMFTTAKGNQGVKLIGVMPAHEKNVFVIPETLESGTYLSQFKKPSVIIGKALADKLHLKLHSKVKISFQNVEGDILSYAFRIEGIYKANNGMLEKTQVFTKQETLTKLLGSSQTYIHEIVVKLKDIDNTKNIQSVWQPKMVSNAVKTWDEISPDMGYAQEMMSTFTYIFMLIILIALSFAIVNTMLMAILERKRELGIMMAVGLNKSKLFMMIMIETVLLAIIATPIGMLLSYSSITYFGQHGLHFLSVAKGLEHFGMSAVIHTNLDVSYYLGITALTIFTTLIAAIFPARKALASKPVDVIKEV